MQNISSERSMATLNGMIEQRLGTSVSEITKMTPDEEAQFIRNSNGYGTSITTVKTRGIEGRGNVLAALGKVSSALEIDRRFKALLD